MEERCLLATSVLPALPGLRIVESPASGLDGQIIVVNLEGAQDVSYGGPRSLSCDVPTFHAPAHLSVQETAIVDEALTQLGETFAGTGVVFTTIRPTVPAPFSTIHVGGDGSAFSQFGSFFGVAEQVDIGNQDRGDNAFVFSEKFNTASTASEFAAALAGTIAHEAGHLLGFEHTTQTPSNGPLDEVADAFGAALGVFNRVVSRSNGSTTYVGSERNTETGVDTGIKWQCAEFVNRYYYVHYGIDLRARWSGNAKDFYAHSSDLGLLRYANGSAVQPQVGDILCFGGGSYGHVAIIRDVSPTQVFAIQQNWFEDSRDASWPITMTISGGTHTVSGSGSYYVQGWLRNPDPTFEIGDWVEATADGVVVRSTPAGTQIDTKNDAEKGTIVEGPQWAVASNGVLRSWWRIEWSDGVTGWSGEIALAKSSTPPAAESGRIVSISPSSFLGGQATSVTVRVQNTGETDDMIVECYSTPSGWSVSPGYFNPIIASGDYYDAVFTVTPPASGGSGTITWRFLDDDILSNDLLDTEYQSVVATLAPTLSVSTSSLDFGSSTTSKTFTVANSGGGTLSYAISEDQAWLSISPTSGSSTGENDTITTTVNRSGERFGTKTGTITIDPSSGSNRTVSVTMIVPDGTPTVSRNSPADASLTLGFGAESTFIATGQDSGGNLDYADWYLIGPETDDAADWWYGDTDFTRDSTYTHVFDVAGDYSLLCEFTDSSGNQGSTSWTIHVNAAPALAVASSSLNFGSLSNRLSFQVRNSGGGTLNYTLGDDRDWIAVTPTSGSSTGEWDTITIDVSRSGLSPADYAGTITVDPDTGSNQYVSVLMTVLDTVAPSAVASLAISGGVSWNSDSTPLFSWEDATDASGIQGYWWSVDDDSPTAGWSWLADTWLGESVETLALNDGSHVFRVYAVDNSANHNAGPVTSLPFTIDANNPSVPVLIGPSGAVSTLRPTFQWQPSNDGTGSGIQKYHLLVESDVLGDNKLDLDVYANSYSATQDLPEEGLNWYVQVQDNAGRWSDWSSPLHIDISLDRTGPGNVVNLAINGGASWNSDSTPQFSWEDATDTSGIQGYWWSVDDDSPTAGWSWLADTWLGESVETLALNDGSHVFRVYAVDNSANHNAGPVTSLSFTVDANNPSVPVLIGPSGAVSTLRPTFQWQPSNDGTGSGIQKYHLLVESDVLGDNKLDLDVYANSYPATQDLPKEGLNWYVRVQDNAGRWSDWSSPLHIIVTGPQITAIRWEDSAGVPLASGATRNTGDTVFIEVDSTGMRGSAATLYLYEDDGLWGADDYIAPSIVVPIPSNNDTGRIAWIVPYHRDDDFLNDLNPIQDAGPEYRLWNTMSALGGLSSQLLEVPEPKITGIRWEDAGGSELADGSVLYTHSTVYIEVDTQNMRGSQATVYLYEDDGFVAGDDLINPPITVAIPAGSDTGRIAWTVPYHADEDFLSDLNPIQDAGPEYRLWNSTAALATVCTRLIEVPEPKVTAIRWVDASGNELLDGTVKNAKTSVFIQAETQNMRGEQATIYLYEDDGALAGDDLIAPPITVNIPSTSDTGQIAYAIPWTTDDDFATDVNPLQDAAPEYRLWSTTSRVGGLTGVSSRLLEVATPVVRWANAAGAPIDAGAVVVTNAAAYLCVEGIGDAGGGALSATIYENEPGFDNTAMGTQTLAYVGSNRWQALWPAQWTEDDDTYSPDGLPEYFFTLDGFGLDSAEIHVRRGKAWHGYGESSDQPLSSGANAVSAMVETPDMPLGVVLDQVVFAWDITSIRDGSGTPPPLQLQFFGPNGLNFPTPLAVNETTAHYNVSFGHETLGTSTLASHGSWGFRVLNLGSQTQVDVSHLEVLVTYHSTLSPANLVTCYDSPGDNKAVILVHGWNPDGSNGGFAEGQHYGGNWITLANGLLSFVHEYSLPWDVLAYDWTANAATGAAISPSAIDNALASRDGGTAEGHRLAEAIRSRFPNLEAIQILAHSAGNWTGHEALIELRQAFPTAELQLTSLDPFVPSGWPSGVGELCQVSFEELGRAGLAIDWLDNYYVVDVATDERFWTSGDFAGWDINRQLDALLDAAALYSSATMNDHGGPIGWYAATVNDFNADQALSAELWEDGHWIGFGSSLLFSDLVSDTTAPSARIVSAPNITSDGVYTLVVRYDDIVAVDRSDIGYGDIRVVGPNGYDGLASLQSVAPAGSDDRQTLTATYTLPPRGAGWDPGDNGIYSIIVCGGEVSDRSENFVPSGTLGEFTVAINTPPTVTAIMVSDTALSDDDTGVGRFTVAIAYSEPMKAWPVPDITFSPSVNATLSSCGGTWNGNTYTANYDVVDAGMTVSGVNIAVAGAQDAAGTPQVAFYAENRFRIDTQNPAAVAFLPADGATEVAVDASLVLTFGEAVRKGSAGACLIKRSLDNAVVATIPVEGDGVSVAGATATLVPPLALAGQTGFYVQVLPGTFEDLEGNDFAGIGDVATWDFTTDATEMHHAPQGADRTVNTPEDVAYTVVVADFAFSDPDDTPPDAFRRVKITSLPQAGTLVLHGAPVHAGDFVDVAQIAAGGLVFSPAADAHGTAYARFTFQVEDDGGTADGSQSLDPTPNAWSIDVTAVPDVVGRYLFYNNSAWDGNNPDANDQDYAAIAPAPVIRGHGHSGDQDEPGKELGKQPLMPGQTASFVNYTSYTKGLNGIILAFDALADPASLGLANFQFRVGNDSVPGDWPAAPTPARFRVAQDVVHPNFPGQPDLVTIIWADESPYTKTREQGAIANQWLQVAVLADSTTGLPANDVFYWGNQACESGNSVVDTNVDQNDEIGALNHPHSAFVPASLSDPYDCNRDKKADQNDAIFARNNPATAFTRINLISVPSAVATPDSTLIGKNATATIAAPGNDRDYRGTALSVRSAKAVSALGSTVTTGRATVRIAMIRPDETGMFWAAAAPRSMPAPGRVAIEGSQPWDAEGTSADLSVRDAALGKAPESPERSIDDEPSTWSLSIHGLHSSDSLDGIWMSRPALAVDAAFASYDQ